MPRVIEIIKRDTTPTDFESKWEYSVELWNHRQDGCVHLRKFAKALAAEKFAARIIKALNDPEIRIEYSEN